MLDNIGDYIEEQLKVWHTPGMALAVMHKGEVILSQGFGMRDVDDPQPVDENTLFAIGSCTKAFTTMGIALLVDEGKLDWDTPLREYLPDFRLYDEVATQQMTPRDLVCHRSGLPRHDLAWYGSPASREELYGRLRYLKPTYPFRYTYQYQNLMYMTAGYLIERITGDTWENFTIERIFKPLGMDAANLSISECENHANAARPHRYDKDADTIKRIPYRSLDAIGPAGSINANLTDMLKWVKMHLNEGKHGDEQFVSAATLQQMHQPHVTMPPMQGSAFTEFSKEFGIGTYGLGWGVLSYRGHRAVWHTGGIDGFITLTALLPDEDIGLIAVNNGGTSLSMVTGYHVFDTLLGLEPIDWSKRFKDLEEKMAGMAEDGKGKLYEKRQPNTEPSLPLDAYVGDYHHGGYGTLTVSQKEGGGLQSVYNGIEATMEHFHHDVFVMKNDEMDLTLPVNFALSLLGEVSTLSAKLEPTGDAIIFDKVAAEESTEEA